MGRWAMYRRRGSGTLAGPLIVQVQEDGPPSNFVLVLFDTPVSSDDVAANQQGLVVDGSTPLSVATIDPYRVTYEFNHTIHAGMAWSMDSSQMSGLTPTPAPGQSGTVT